MNSFKQQFTRCEYREGTGGLRLTGLLAASRLEAWVASSLTSPDSNCKRPLTTLFPRKGQMIQQHTRSLPLETPLAVFDQGVVTPNDRFYARWHLTDIPTKTVLSTFRLKFHGHVVEPVERTLDDLVSKFERVEFAPIKQCSGNSRGVFASRLAGAQGANGAKGKPR